MFSHVCVHPHLGRGIYLGQEGYLPWLGGTYLGWWGIYLGQGGYLPWLGGTYLGWWGIYLGQGGYLPWLGGGTYLDWGVPTLAGVYLPWPGGTYLEWGVPTLAGGVIYLGWGVCLPWPGGTYLGRGVPTFFLGGYPILSGQQMMTTGSTWTYVAAGMPRCSSPARWTFFFFNKSQSRVRRVPSPDGSRSEGGKRKCYRKWYPEHHGNKNQNAHSELQWKELTNQKHFFWQSYAVQKVFLGKPPYAPKCELLPPASGPAPWRLYAAGGMPLAFTQENFHVLLNDEKTSHFKLDITNWTSPRFGFRRQKTISIVIVFYPLHPVNEMKLFGLPPMANFYHRISHGSGGDRAPS